MRISAELLDDLRQCALSLDGEIAPVIVRCHASWLREIASKVEDAAKAANLSTPRPRQPLDARACKDT